MTVTSAYDQLISEGYLIARRGQGTFISKDTPHLVSPNLTEPHPTKPPETFLPFQTGLPDLSLFPHKQWGRHLKQVWSNPEIALLNRPQLFGWFPLREMICEHLSAWRGLECSPEQVIITGGAWDAFDILCNVLFKANQTLAMEDPGWSLLRQIFKNLSIETIPVPIDKDGLDATTIPKNTSAAIITPSRHYPTGISMPLSRRLALLEWARQNSAVIIEDDYDSEFRYQGNPLPSLSGLDGLQHTIYLGSFSKLLSHTLRLGYIVIPLSHVEQAKSYMATTGSRASLIPQPALAQFMASGEFAVHLRRMRRTYAKRQSILLSHLSTIDHLLNIAPDPSGMHLCCLLKDQLSNQITDIELAKLGAKEGLNLGALSAHSILPNPPQGLLLGYAAFDKEVLEEAAKKLVGLLNLWS
jgi:GntR family transcriptional regulator/MocR family aminotransferase